MAHSPAILSRHTVRHLLVTRFLSRFGDVIWMVDDTSRADEDPAGLGVEVYQGAGRPDLRKLLEAHS